MFVITIKQLTNFNILSYTFNFIKTIAICTFNGEMGDKEIRSAFLDLIEIRDIKTLKFIIFDFTEINSFCLPKNHISNLKSYTRFSAEWNKNINAITVGTNKDIISGFTEIMQHKSEFPWNYMYFKKIEEALNWCKENE